MSTRWQPEDLGEPGLRIAGFQLWVHGLGSGSEADGAYGDWLRVTAHCGSSGASVWAQGEILTASDIESFGAQCEGLSRRERSLAVLEPVEPYLKVSLDAGDRVGHLRLCVEITPVLLDQFHRLQFEVDRTYLPRTVEQCRAILRTHSKRGAQE